MAKANGIGMDGQEIIDGDFCIHIYICFLYVCMYVFV